jgi:hypothetical protein
LATISTSPIVTSAAYEKLYEVAQDFANIRLIEVPEADILKYHFLVMGHHRMINSNFRPVIENRLN